MGTLEEKNVYFALKTFSLISRCTSHCFVEYFTLLGVLHKCMKMLHHLTTATKKCTRIHVEYEKSAFHAGCQTNLMLQYKLILTQARFCPSTTISCSSKNSINFH